MAKLLIFKERKSILMLRFRIDDQYRYMKIRATDSDPGRLRHHESNTADHRVQNTLADRKEADRVIRDAPAEWTRATA